MYNNSWGSWPHKLRILRTAALESFSEKLLNCFPLAQHLSITLGDTWEEKQILVPHSCHTESAWHPCCQLAWYSSTVGYKQNIPLWQAYSVLDEDPVIMCEQSMNCHHCNGLLLLVLEIYPWSSLIFLCPAFFKKSNHRFVLLTLLNLLKSVPKSNSQGPSPLSAFSYHFSYWYAP